jgi:hypothetical protein
MAAVAPDLPMPPYVTGCAGKLVESCAGPNVWNGRFRSFDPLRMTAYGVAS